MMLESRPSRAPPRARWRRPLSWAGGVVIAGIIVAVVVVALTRLSQDSGTVAANEGQSTTFDELAVPAAAGVGPVAAGSLADMGPAPGTGRPTAMPGKAAPPSGGAAAATGTATGAGLPWISGKGSPSGQASPFQLNSDQPWRKPSSDLTLMEQVLQAKDSSRGDPLQLATLNSSAASMVKLYLMNRAAGQSQAATDTCFPADAEELIRAVEEEACARVVLVGSLYELSREILVRRRVLIMGHPVTLPRIDAGDGERAIRVTEGGFLELRFVRIRPGGGVLRDRYGLEGAGLASKVRDMRGGSIFFDAGALGGNLVEVIFITSAVSPEAVQSAIDDTLNGIGWRVWGGHLLVAAGEVHLLNCHFIDNIALIPLTDILMVGGDVLVIAGSIYLTGCTFTSNIAFASYAGMGLTTAVLGGIFVMTWGSMQNTAVAEAVYCAGANTFVGGGVKILTAVNFSYVAAVANFIGIASYMIGAGVFIMTGVTIEVAFTMLCNVGAGFFTALGTGVLVQSGVAYSCATGPIYSSLTGGSIFVGSGSSTSVGVLHSFAASTSSYHGQGGLVYDVGQSVWVGCPMVSVFAITAFTGLGGLVSHPAGNLVFIGNPIFIAAALNYFAGLGGIVYVGAGSAVIGHSPSYVAVGPSYVSGDDSKFYVQGNTNSSGKGKATYVDKSTNRRQQEYRQLRRRSTALATVWDVLEGSHLGNDSSSSSSSSPSRVAVFNLSSTDRIDAGLREQLAAWVPESSLRVAEDVQSMPQPLAAASAPSTGDGSGPRARGPTLYVGEDVESCSICGVDSVTGPKAQACYGNCGDLPQDLPFQAKEREDAFSWDEVPFEAQHIVLADVRPLSPASPDAPTPLAATDLRDAVQAWVWGEGFHDVKVAAYSTGPDELTAEWLADPPPSTKATDACSVTHHFKVVFVANEQAAASLFHNALAPSEGDAQAAGLRDSLVASVTDSLARRGIEVCDVDLGFDRTLFVPAYNSPDMLKQTQSTSAAEPSFSVALLDPAREGVPVGATEVRTGRDYLVRLQGFPPALPLSVHYIGRQEMVDPTAQAKQLVVPIETIPIVTDDKGGVDVPWRADATLPAGDFYIKAEDALGTVFGLSQIYELVAIDAPGGEGQAAGQAGVGGRRRRRMARRLGPIFDPELI